MYGIVQRYSVHFVPCDMIFLLHPVMYGIVRLATVYTLDPQDTSHGWSEVTVRMPQDVINGPKAILSVSDRVYLVGGTSGKHIQSTAVYTWKPGQRLPNFLDLFHVFGTFVL